VHFYRKDLKIKLKHNPVLLHRSNEMTSTAEPTMGVAGNKPLGAAPPK
jgi:hypothetical protein